MEAGAAGEPLYAEASADALVQEMLSTAQAEASRLVEEARKESTALILSARDQAEEERQRAWQKGYFEGSEEGRHSYDELLAERLREDDEMLKRVIDELYSDRERTYSGLEDEVLKLALEIVRKVIGPAEEALGGVFESLVRNALRQIAPDGKIIIRVSPVEYERFFSSGNAVIKLDGGITVTASVLRDVSLKEGDCIIDTEVSTVNAGLDSQLKYVKLAFDRAKAL